MKKYTVGFLFNSSYDHVLLIHKNRPSWQRGGLNGLGGLLHDSEELSAGMTRKLEEESNLKQPENSWKTFAELRTPNETTYFLYAIYSGDIAEAVTMTDEQVEWFKAEEVPDGLMSDTKWLLAIARDHLTQPNSKRYTIKDCSAAIS